MEKKVSISGRRMKMLLCLALCLVCGKAGAADEELVRAEYNYRHYGIADGLPTEIVECVYQDSRGFIWFGTEHGCVCFDGYTFKTYLANKSLPINKIEENEKGDIVIYGYYFVYVLDRETDELRITFRDRNLNYDVDKSPGLPRGYGIYTRRDTRKQAVFHLQQDTLAEFFSHPLLDEMDYGQSVYYDAPAGQFYIPDRNSHIRIVDREGNVKATLDNVDVCRFVHTETTGLLAVGYEKVWKISPRGAEVKYKFPRHISRSLPNSDRDMAVITDSDGNLIIRDTKGVYRYRNGKLETVIDNINIPRAILFDREGNLWFTSRQGIYNFFRLSFITYKVNSQEADIVYSIVPVQKDEVYMATGNGKLLYVGNDRFEELPYPPHPAAKTEFSYQSINVNGVFYFTTYSDILQYADGQFRWLNIPPEQYHVASCTTRKNELAVGGWEKLFILDSAGRKTREIPHVDIRRSTIYTVQSDNKNRLWIGGHDGICCIGETDSLYFFGDDMMNAETSDKDQAGRIWFGCEGHIYYTDGDTIRLFMEFPNVIIGNLRYTRNNQIVVSDNTGIRIIDAATRRIVRYDYSNGYSSGEPSWNTMTEDYEGNIWMGTQGPNVLKFNPAGLMHAARQPLLHITSAQYSENNIDMNGLCDGALLNHRQRNFRFSFVGLCYSNPADVRYRYRLTGFQDDWSEPVSVREVTFNNLSPGHYTFEIYADGGTDESRSEMQSVAFSVAPAFWQTTWFLTAGVAFLMLAGAGMALYVQRRRHSALLEKLRAEKELNELRISSIRLKAIPHFNANVLAAIEYYIANRTKEEAMRILGVYSDFTFRTLSGVDKASRSLSEELAYVKMYLDLEKVRFLDKFDFCIDIAEDVDRYVQLPNMILHTYCENAVKHGLMPRLTGGLLTIRVWQHERYVCIRVEDNGVGRAYASRNPHLHSTKQGLSILNRQIEIYNCFNQEKIRQEVEDLFRDGEPAGTCFIVEVPLGFIYVN